MTEQLARIAEILNTSVCLGCGDLVGINYDCCVECSREVAAGVVCEGCGWGAGQNVNNCSRCWTLSIRSPE